MDRPKLDNTISIIDFKDFYWLKEELVQFCKSYGLDSTGGKLEITGKITCFLETGAIIKHAKQLKNSSSNFDWNKEPLTLDTVLTDNYKNSENVRAFYTSHIGNHFHFTVEFMNWSKANHGKTLGDAIVEWKRLCQLKKDKNIKSEIAPQFEYNQYMRDFIADNPDKTSKDAMKFWKLKRSIRGNNKYSKSDLDLLEKIKP